MMLEAQDGATDIPGALFEDGPCDDCRHAPRCGRELLACDAFAVWVAGRGPRHWQTAPRQPTRERYAQVLRPQ